MPQVPADAAGAGRCDGGGDGGGISPPTASRQRHSRIALLALFLYFSIPQSTHFKASKVMEHSFNLLNGELAKA